MRMNYSRDRKRVDYFEQSARTAAGLPAKKEENGSAATGAGKEARRRKVKVPMVAGSDFSGYLELIVEGESVYIVSSSAHETKWPELTVSHMMTVRSSHCRVWRLVHPTSELGHSRSPSPSRGESQLSYHPISRLPCHPPSYLSRRTTTMLSLPNPKYPSRTGKTGRRAKSHATTPPGIHRSSPRQKARATMMESWSARMARVVIP